MKPRPTKKRLYSVKPLVWDPVEKGLWYRSDTSIGWTFCIQNEGGRFAIEMRSEDRHHVIFSSEKTLAAAKRHCDETWEERILGSALAEQKEKA